MKKLYLGADHVGLALKEKIKSWLEKQAIHYEDRGAFTFNPNDDYPLFGKKVAQAVARNKGSFGILWCGSGQGVCIAANKIKSIRAAVAENVKDAFLARKDDNVNVLCLSGRSTSLPQAKKIVQKFLATPFEDIPKRRRRIREIQQMEK